jgi:membrane protease YdiL (CAAX protease family)
VVGKPMSALMVLAWAHLSRTPWRDLGFVQPRSWPVAIAAGIAIGVVVKLIMKAVVMPLLGAPPVNEAYRFLEGTTSVAPTMVYAIVIGAGFGEETLFRGFMFERLRRLLGARVWAPVAIVLLTSLLFGLAHYANQGLSGAQQGMIVGIVYGGMYLYARSLYPVMITHVAFNLTAWWIIYLGLETKVARFFF